jgi:hypothetical protein
MYDCVVTYFRDYRPVNVKVILNVIETPSRRQSETENADRR